MIKITTRQGDFKITKTRLVELHPSYNGTSYRYVLLSDLRYALKNNSTCRCRYNDPLWEKRYGPTSFVTFISPIRISVGCKDFYDENRRKLAKALRIR